MTPRASRLCHLLSLGFRVPVLESARHLFTSVVQANPELYRREGAEPSACQAQNRAAHFPHVCTLGIPEGGGRAQMAGAGCSRALYSTCMPDQSACLPVPCPSPLPWAGELGGAVSLSGLARLNPSYVPAHSEEPGCRPAPGAGWAAKGFPSPQSQARQEG